MRLGSFDFGGIEQGIFFLLQVGTWLKLFPLIGGRRVMILKSSFSFEMLLVEMSRKTFDE